MLRLIFLIVLALLKSTAAVGEVPQKVTICQLKSDPSAYNHKLLEVRGFVSHGFEDFTLLDPGCTSPHGIWLEYGGLISSRTIYCCPGSPERRRPKNPIVEDIPIPLTDDKRFRTFDRLIQHRPRALVRAMIVGRFFSGDQESGYGHFGLFSLKSEVGKVMPRLSAACASETQLRRSWISTRQAAQSTLDNPPAWCQLRDSGLV
jgi:hypothetical protein